MDSDDVHNGPPGPVASTSDLIDRLSRFQGPPQVFLTNLLAVQCQLSSASAGAILRTGAEGGMEVLAVFPQQQPDTPAPPWLSHAAQAGEPVLRQGATAIRPLHDTDDLYGAPPRRHIVMIPLRGAQGLRGMTAFLVDSGDDKAVAACREKLELTTSLLSLYEMRLTLQRRQGDLRRLQSAMEVLAALNEQERFHGMAMALCNDLASRWECDRVGLGFLRGRYVQLKALSHTEKFSRKMQIVQDIESAMEECLDQDVEVLHPSSPEATFVSRSAADLARHGSTSVLSVPLRHAGEPTAVLTLERPADDPFDADEVEALRLTGNLITPRLVNRYHQDRWFGARAAGGVRKGLAFAVGPKHTWMKLIILGVLGLAAFVTFVHGDYNAQGTFTLETIERQVIPAPYDGFLAEINAVPGDSVIKDKTILATMDTALLVEQIEEASARQRSYHAQAEVASRDWKVAEAAIYRLQADAVAAQFRLLKLQEKQAMLISGIDGVVISKDLNRSIGAGGPVETGDILFEVAPLEALRAEVLIGEDQIGEVHLGQRGELAATSHPDQRIAFVVEHINPVAEVVDQDNIFRVRVRLELDENKLLDWMKPGLEGVARIHITTMPYGKLWTRKMVNWFRMKLWL